MVELQEFSISRALEGLEAWADSSLFRGEINLIIEELQGLVSSFDYARNERSTDLGDLVNLQSARLDYAKNAQSSAILERLCKACLGYSVNQDISAKALQKIQQYAYVLELIVECKKAALSVSVDGWSKACNKLMANC